MPKTLQVQLTDAAIRKHAADPDAFELKDPRHPLRFRYRRNDRTKGSWHVVRYDRGATWRKAGNWPEISARVMIENLPAVLSRLQLDPKAPAVLGAWTTVGELLTWFSERMAAGRSLSVHRRSTALSAIRRQLMPRLSHLPLSDLNKSSLDLHLYMPMQAECSLAHVRAVFGVLKLATKRAVLLDRLPADPLAAVVFGDFNKTAIKPKGARLRHSSVADLFSRWAAALPDAHRSVAFGVVMLAHGTRISETRVARWQEVDLVNREWFIPARNTKGGRDHVIPLTRQAIAFLQQYRDCQYEYGYTGAFLFPGKSGQCISRSDAFSTFTWLGSGEWTSHDLRKLARTTWAELGVDSVIGRLLLNQALPMLEATYVQTVAMPRKREALERWHDWLDERGFVALHGETSARPAVSPIPTHAAAQAARAAVPQPNV